MLPIRLFATIHLLSFAPLLLAQPNLAEIKESLNSRSFPDRMAAIEILADSVPTQPIPALNLLNDHLQNIARTSPNFDIYPTQAETFYEKEKVLLQYRKELFATIETFVDAALDRVDLGEDISEEYAEEKNDEPVGITYHAYLLAYLDSNYPGLKLSFRRSNDVALVTLRLHVNMLTLLYTEDQKLSDSDAKKLCTETVNSFVKLMLTKKGMTFQHWELLALYAPSLRRYLDRYHSTKNLAALVAVAMEMGEQLMVKHLRGRWKDSDAVSLQSIADLISELRDDPSQFNLIEHFFEHVVGFLSEKFDWDSQVDPRTIHARDFVSSIRGKVRVLGKKPDDLLNAEIFFEAHYLPASAKRIEAELLHFRMAKHLINIEVHEARAILKQLRNEVQSGVDPIDAHRLKDHEAKLRAEVGYLKPEAVPAIFAFSTAGCELQLKPN